MVYMTVPSENIVLLQCCVRCNVLLVPGGGSIDQSCLPITNKQ